MTKLFGLALSLFLANASHAALTAEEVYEKMSGSVLTLDVENFQKEKFVGSAFLVVRPGLAVTAWHVVHDAAKIEARFPGDEKVKVLGLVGKDESRDLAFLEIETKKQPSATLATVKPRVGTRVFVIGAPQGMDFSIADGLISQVRDVEGFNQYQLSCPISPGNSGGPVVNDRGEIVGVVSWRRPDAQSLSFAIPSLDVARLQTSLLKKPVAVGEFAEKKISKRAEPVSARKTDAERGMEEFRQALFAEAGKQVTVTIDDGKERKKFTFEVPKRSK